MATIHTLQEIQEVLSGVNLTPYIEQGFIAYSNNEVIVPPVGELIFVDPPGDTHIKYGYIKGDEIYVIKIASGFYNNPELGLSSSSGLMLVFSQKTGILQNILLDDGHLTNIRTAIAGQIAAKYLAPETINTIGVLGTGIQARMQVEYLKSVTPCREVVVWGRTPERVEEYKYDMKTKGFNVAQADFPAQVASSANLIITTTPSSTPLLFAADIQSGTHITAMGSDTDKKQELDSSILARADIVVGDSISQCRERGEISKALAAGVIEEKQIVELGSYISNPPPSKRDNKTISVVDLTGVAVQDIQIAAAVCEKLMQKNREPGSKVS
jgi:ornithine cyclodeaminase